MPEAANRDSYYQSLEAQSKLPAGFTGATRSLSFSSTERGTEDTLEMNLSLITAARPVKCYAGVTTTNRFPGAPVLLARELFASKLPVSGVVINNKVANVGVPGGLEDARRITRRLESLCRGGSWFSLSTGVIGWRLPVEAMSAELEALYAARHPRAGLEIAEAIMTTDRYPKLKKVTLPEGSMLGVAKGAGMIEPNLATMLSVIVTDLRVSPDTAERALRASVEKSFNRIGVDGEQSTSDVVLLLSSEEGEEIGEPDFQEALDEVTLYLAREVVRNGEGTAHVIRTEVRGAGNDESALYLARRVSNSPLVKTAIYGNDPNVGRILMALGDGLSDLGLPGELETLTIEIGGTRVFEDGAFLLTPDKERALAATLRECAMDPEEKGYPQHDREVTIDIDLGGPGDSEVVYGSDLSYEYVRENADYRT